MFSSSAIPKLISVLLQWMFVSVLLVILRDWKASLIFLHGGSTNAFTSSEYTNYYFDVNPDCFEEALDRFAQFFIKPLMSADATTREIKAVDSENQKNLLSDVWRMNQLQKHLSVKDHPYHNFSTEKYVPFRCLWSKRKALPRPGQGGIRPKPKMNVLQRLGPMLRRIQGRGTSKLTPVSGNVFQCSTTKNFHVVGKNGPMTTFGNISQMLPKGSISSSASLMRL